MQNAEILEFVVGFFALSVNWQAETCILHLVQKKRCSHTHTHKPVSNPTNCNYLHDIQVRRRWLKRELKKTFKFCLVDIFVFGVLVYLHQHQPASLRFFKNFNFIAGVSAWCVEGFFESFGCLEGIFQRNVRTCWHNVSYRKPGLFFFLRLHFGKVCRFWKRSLAETLKVATDIHMDR